MHPFMTIYTFKNCFCFTVHITSVVANKSSSSYMVSFVPYNSCCFGSHQSFLSDICFTRVLLLDELDIGSRPICYHKRLSHLSKF